MDRRYSFSGRPREWKTKDADCPSETASEDLPVTGDLGTGFDFVARALEPIRRVDKGQQVLQINTTSDLIQ